MNALVEPQPAPAVTGSQPVWPLVIDYLTTSPEYHTTEPLPARVTALLVDDMRARDEQGRKKYGVPLTADNGRDHLVDAFQEALDLCAYLCADVNAQTDAHEREFSCRLFERAVEQAWSLRIRIAIRRGEV